MAQSRGRPDPVQKKLSWLALGASVSASVTASVSVKAAGHGFEGERRALK